MDLVPIVIKLREISTVMSTIHSTVDGTVELKQKYALNPPTGPGKLDSIDLEPTGGQMELHYLEGMTNMPNTITLTPKAVKAALEALDSEDTPPIGIRAGVMGGGCSGYTYNLDYIDTTEDIDEDDIQLTYDTLTVYIDCFSAQLLEGTEIDYIDTLQKKGFVFNNPNAKTTCGCGSSFS
jgi:iron-sulfur cluster assembly accessory protein